MNKVLILCTGNTCRSVMAAALLKKYAEQAGLDITIESAGLAAFSGDTATEPTQAALAAHGVDASGHRSRRVYPAMVDEADLILVMTRLHRETVLTMFGHELADKVFLLKEYAAGSAAEGEENGRRGQENSAADSNRIRDMDISDPFGHSQDVYAETAKAIAEAVNQLVRRWQ